jgi:hypothetical protein
MLIHVSLSYFQALYLIIDDTFPYKIFYIFKNCSFQLYFYATSYKFLRPVFFDDVSHECWSKYKTRQKLETDKFSDVVTKSKSNTLPNLTLTHLFMTVLLY